MDEKKITPMMQQWADCKKEAKEAVLLFRMGDFYEAFYDDAALLSEVLELTLTKRQGIPMSGVPWQHAEGYIERLVTKGYKVAIAEQVENPKEAKGLVQRKIVRVVTPGTLLRSEKSSLFVAALSELGSVIALAVLELSTGEFRVCEFETFEEVKNELARLQPKEILSSKKLKEKYDFGKLNATWTLLQDSHFEQERALRILAKHFRVTHLDGFGLKGKNGAIKAAGALLGYIQEELFLSISHIQKITPFSNDHFLWLDDATEKNLELTQSLLQLLDKTNTPMGARCMWHWLKKPLFKVAEIKKRQEAVEALYYSEKVRHELISELKDVRDLERLSMKISSNLANPKDFISLGHSLEKVAPLKSVIKKFTTNFFQEISEKLIDVSELVTDIKERVQEDPPLRIGEGALFKEGYHKELDDLREKKKNGKNWLANYQTKLKEETGIKSLKVGYNKIFGFYIEVSRGSAKLVPEFFHKKQTLVNGERFTTTELKEYESDLLTAEERILAIELKLFEELRLYVAQFISDIFNIAEAIGILDTLLSLAVVAKEKGFVCPLIDESETLEIIEGRHPIVEDCLASNQFIPNDTQLNSETHLMLITGPNMAGKSTYIRQVAIIVILGQMGSFVPAAKAHFGVFDKIFTRIGANDDLSRGQSTFMVEMSETANILNNATSRSLVILDEIGRGTSTYDGVAIAWAVLEHLVMIKEKRAKTLFATHYFELTHLEKKLKGIVNYHAAALENKDGIVFLHKIEKGVAPRSYGIHVAKLAGLPLPVIVRAQVILSRLEKAKEMREEKKEEQLLLFSL